MTIKRASLVGFITCTTLALAPVALSGHPNNVVFARGAWAVLLNFACWATISHWLGMAPTNVKNSDPELALRPVSAIIVIIGSVICSLALAVAFMLPSGTIKPVHEVMFHLVVSAIVLRQIIGTWLIAGVSESQYQSKINPTPKELSRRLYNLERQISKEQREGFGTEWKELMTGISHSRELLSYSIPPTKKLDQSVEYVEIVEAIQCLAEELKSPYDNSKSLLPDVGLLETRVRHLATSINE